MASCLARFPPRVLYRPPALSTTLLICDLQARFQPLFPSWPALTHTAATLLRAAALLQLPVIATEQNPRVLLATDALLSPLLADVGAIPRSKMRFSMVPCVGEEGTSDQGWKSDAFILTGIEAHVCILQTAQDLLAAGRAVYIVTDGVSSQRSADRSEALRSLERAGAVLTTTESVLFALLESADHPKFRDMSKLVKAHNAGVPSSQVQ